jgi:hypothetical protein
MPLALDGFTVYLSSMIHIFPDISAHSPVMTIAACRIMVLSGEKIATIANIINRTEIAFLLLL